MNDVTQILQQIESGDPSAAEQLMPLVYQELRKLAGVKLAQEKSGQTIQATALVHEAYLRLVDEHQAEHWNSRRHFFAAAAQAMRRILVDRAREKLAVKRGGQFIRQEVDLNQITETASPEEILSVHDALDALAEEDPLCADLVKLQYFAGFSVEESANALGISRATAYRLWTYARAWLAAALQDEDSSK